MAWQVFKRLSDADLNNLALVNQSMRALVQAFRGHQEAVFNARVAEIAEMLQRL